MYFKLCEAAPDTHEWYYVYFSLCYQKFHRSTRYETKGSDNVHGRLYQYMFNPLTDDKIFNWSKMKQIADDILKCI